MRVSFRPTRVNKTFSLEATLPANMGKRNDVLDHVQCSGSNCVMTTIVDPPNGLDSSSLFAVCISDSPQLYLADLSLGIGLRTGRK